jgi:Spy/CpxP family protein refolding chaperone
MKKGIPAVLAIALGFGLGLATTGYAISPAARHASAQQNGTPAPSKPPVAKPQGNADEPENDVTLYLTTDQKARIKAIRNDADLQVQAAEKDATLTPEQRERRVKAIRKATRAQVFAVLTPDQQKTWSAEQREKREAKSSPPPKTQ